MQLRAASPVPACRAVHQMSLVYSPVQPVPFLPAGQSTKCPSFTAPCSQSRSCLQGSPPNVPRLQPRAASPVPACRAVHQMSLVYSPVQPVPFLPAGQSTKCPSFTAPCSSPPNVPRLQLRAARAVHAASYLITQSSLLRIVSRP